MTAPIVIDLQGEPGRAWVYVTYWADATDELPPDASPFTEARRLCQIRVPLPLPAERRMVLSRIELVIDGEQVAGLNLAPAWDGDDTEEDG
jgi:hypothetical protein